MSTNNFENQIFPRKSKNGRTQIDGAHHFDDPLLIPGTTKKPEPDKQ
ncbi:MULTISPECIES: hypothetical protein [unclassified Snodgrassella]|nr:MULTISPECIES: hypothetical protein [unclassified Snodgrassella]MBI0097266.1 hypothetical protein [Snodgrassella sp. W8134]MBI0101001.1 hypothetical protein [Snodgrassella sp. W8135]